MQKKKKCKGYPHLTIEKIAHVHPREIIETTEIRGEKGTTVITRSMSSESVLKEIPKEKNPDLITVKFSNIKISIYKKTKKGFIYDSKQNHIGTFRKNDLKSLWFDISKVLKTLKK